MGRKAKARPVPDQDKRICGSICLCQLTIVLSCVSLVYLSVAVYMPSYKTFRSGFESEAVICETVNKTVTNYCPWVSCGEWCLTKTSGNCTQIEATVRRNGTDIILNNCSRINATPCEEAYPDQLDTINCNKVDTKKKPIIRPCANLTGFYNCTTGICRRWSEKFDCNYTLDHGETLIIEKDKIKMTGFFECQGRKCTKVSQVVHCHRRCSKVTTHAVNVYLMQGNTLVTADCENGHALKEARGSDPGIPIEPTKFWDEYQGVLLTNCMEVVRSTDGSQINATDCVNGTILNETDIIQPFVYFPDIWQLFENSNKTVDPTYRYLPPQNELTIYNRSKLYINLEACVNTLRGECRDFEMTHGSDGRNNTARSRYLCYYNKNDQSFVVARFDLMKTYRELLVASILPSVLFVVSFITLCIITRSVRVGDDAKMRCQYCIEDHNSDMEDNLIKKSNSKMEGKLNQVQTLSEDDNLPEVKTNTNAVSFTEAPTTSKNLIALCVLKMTDNREEDKEMIEEQENKTKNYDNDSETDAEKPLVML